MIGKEALFVISGLKRYKDDEEKLEKLIKTHVSRLLKMDMIAVLVELERQDEVTLALKVFLWALVLFFFFLPMCNVFFFGNQPPCVMFHDLSTYFFVYVGPGVPR